MEKFDDEVWIDPALLHPDKDGFSNREILNRTQESIYGAIRLGILIQISTHCVANRPAQPNGCRMLYRLPDGTKHLFNGTDDNHSSRKNGKTNPEKNDIPEKHHYLIDWYKNEYNCTQSEKTKEKPIDRPRHPKHNERCPECKRVLEELLKQLYGDVKRNYKSQVGTFPTNFKDHKYEDYLTRIFEELKKNRGYDVFVKVNTLPRCDFFITKPGFVLEFDESQHFSAARKLALELYPEGLKLGYDKDKWIRLCDELDSKDNDPPYRDEQRAWYDTIRDFMPDVCNLEPTVRIYAGDFPWCSLNPTNKGDLQKFKRLIRN
ncbi:MAG: hypothetical protein WC046_08895 [Candidatus Bathyarchaeia archaeon]|jgi:hypothetical protein